MTPPVSAVMITLNAERLLSPVLDALRWCDERLVVDCGSTDRTVQIAEASGARVIYRPFDGFGPQKAFAVSQARNDWVLVIDADELMPEALRDEIEQTLARVERGELPYRGFLLPISLVFLGRLMRHGGEHRMPHLRLFDRRCGNYDDARVHEDVVLNAPVGRLRNDLIHDSYGSLEEYLDKFNRYTTAGALDLRRRERRTSAARIALRFPATFIKEYLGKRNVLNGYPGFLWSLLSAVYPVVKYAKLRELYRREAHDQRDRSPGAPAP